MSIPVARSVSNAARSPVIVHEEPRIPAIPASPNVSFNLLAGLLGGGAAGLLLAGLVGMRRNRGR